MENEVKEEKIEVQKVTPKKKKKIVLISIGIFLVLIIGLMFMFRNTWLHVFLRYPVAPTAESIGNPQNIQASLGFSIYNLTAEVNKTSKVDLTLETFTQEGISKGTIIISYDPQMVTKVKVTPVMGSTSLIPNAIFSEVKYNPDNVVIKFDMPAGSSPITGKGRIAEFSFTPVAYEKQDKTRISYDLSRSEILNTNGSVPKPLKLSRGDLDLTLIPHL